MRDVLSLNVWSPCYALEPEDSGESPGIPFDITIESSCA